MQGCLRANFGEAQFNEILALSDQNQWPCPVCRPEEFPNVLLDQLDLKFRCLKGGECAFGPFVSVFCFVVMFLCVFVVSVVFLLFMFGLLFVLGSFVCLCRLHIPHVHQSFLRSLGMYAVCGLLLIFALCCFEHFNQDHCASHTDITRTHTHAFITQGKR